MYPFGPKNNPHKIIDSNIKFDTLIGPQTSFYGNIAFDKAIRIDGSIKGNINPAVLGSEHSTTSIVVGSGGVVNGNVTADTVINHGTITGNISARSVYLSEKSTVRGDVSYSSLRVDAGATILGKLDIILPTEVPSKGSNVVKLEENGTHLSGAR